MPRLAKESPPAILIVDDDLGFLVWLGLTLGGGGFVTVPATTSSQAREVIQEMHITINLAVLNFDLQGVPELSSTLRRHHPRVKLIAIQERGSASGSDMADATHSRSKLGWLTLVRKLLGLEKATGAK